MVEKLTFNSRATALVDIPAVSMPITRSASCHGRITGSGVQYFSNNSMARRQLYLSFTHFFCR